MYNNDNDIYHEYCNNYDISENYINKYQIILSKINKNEQNKVKKGIENIIRKNTPKSIFIKFKIIKKF